MVTLVGLSLVASGAMGGVIFQDDFSTGLGNWTTGSVGGGGVFSTSGLMGMTSGAIAAPPAINYAIQTTAVDIKTSITGGLDVAASIDLAGMNSYTHQTAKMRIYFDGDNYFNVEYKPSPGTVEVSGIGGGTAISSPVDLSDTSWVNTPMHLQIGLTGTDVVFTAWDLSTQTVDTGSYAHGMTISTLPDGKMYIWQFTNVAYQNYHTAYFDNALIEAVPEPATLSLLGLGGVLALIRRRR